MLTTRASGFAPSSLAISADATARTAAPSLIPLEVPAVTVPSRWKAGESCARPSSVTSARGGSSRDIVSLRPSRCTSTGTISSSNTPAASAACARRWLSTANSSCSRRLMPWLFATRSAVWPSEIVQSAGRRGLVNRQPTVLSATAGGVRSHARPGFSMT